MLRKEWHDRFLALGFTYVARMEKEQFLLEMLIKFEAVRKTTVMIYASMVIAKELVPIEKLAPERKDELWTECRPFTTTLKRDEVIEFVKCYHALDRLAAMGNETPF